MDESRDDTPDPAPLEPATSRRYNVGVETTSRHQGARRRRTVATLVVGGLAAFGAGFVLGGAARPMDRAPDDPEAPAVTSRTEVIDLRQQYDAIRSELRDLSERMATPRGADPHRVPALAQSLEDRIVALDGRLVALERQMKDVAQALRNLPVSQAMDFDPSAVPDRSQTRAVLSKFIGTPEEELDEELRLSSMQHVLSLLGRPDHVQSQSNGGAWWIWTTDFGQVEVFFSWGRVTRVRTKKID